MALADWFLTKAERGNDATRLGDRHPGDTAWTTGNAVTPLPHGASYFPRLRAVVDSLGEGDQLLFTDWRGDPDELLDGPGSSVSEVFGSAAERGVVVKGLVWRSHTDKLQFSADENRHIGDRINAAGGEVLLDQRVRRGGSHHQKLVVVRRPGSPDGDVAFAGGIDLSHSRHDDDEHWGDRQRQAFPSAYGNRPPWHDLQLEVRGPAVGDLDTTFRERWEDPAPLDNLNPVRNLVDRSRGADLSADRLPPQPPDPPTMGTCAVQVLRTYPLRRPRYPFAPSGERSIARAYAKAIQRGRRLIYLEDQYLWSTNVAELFAEALAAHPDLHVVAVVPRHPDKEGGFSLPPAVVGRELALDVVREAGYDRVAVFDLENRVGTPIYVHAKVAVVDDVWASVGSANLNRRSFGHDSELACGVLDETRDGRAPADPAGLGDGARRFARDLRLTLWREHLGRAEGDVEDLLEPHEAFDAFRAGAERLERWYAGGCAGVRPPGHLRPHRPEKLGAATKLWAVPFYRTVYDPDGRPMRLRLRGEW